MNDNKILLRRIILLVLFLISFVIIVFWKRNGEISSDLYSILIIDLIVMFNVITTDVYNAWRATRKNE